MGKQFIEHRPGYFTGWENATYEVKDFKEVLDIPFVKNFSERTGFYKYAVDVETKPEYSWITTARDAEKQITENGLWVGIGNAHRILDGGSNFNASMNLVMMLPLNIEMERHILNIYAKTIVDGIDYYEKQMNSLEEKVWADELWEKLVSAGYEESVKQDEYWSNRQQATMFESQQEFIDKVIKAKKRGKKKS